MKKAGHIPPLSISNVRGYLTTLFLLFVFFLAAQNTIVFKIYNQTVREGTAIGVYNNGNNYLINTCSGNQAQYLWTDAQGGLLDTQNDFVGSYGQYRYDADNYIKTDSVGSSPSRDVRLTKMRRDGSTVWAKTYPLSMDNFGQFAVPTSDGGFLVAGATQVANDTTYKIQLIKTDANGTLQWQKIVTQGLTYSRVRRPNATSCYDIINGKMITITNAGQTSDGGFYLQYLTSEPSFECASGGGRGAVLIRLDANGNYLWHKSDLSGTQEGKSHKVAATENGNILLLYTRAAGDSRTCTSNEYKLIKLSATGATLWSFEKGGSTCSLDRPQLASTFGIFPNGDVVLETQGMTIFRKISGQTGQQIDSIIQTPIDSARGATAIATLADGSFAVTGFADGTSIWKTFFYKNKFNTPSVSTGYCASKGIAPWELWTRNVSFNTINNTSEKFKDYATLGFSDYTNLSTTVTKGQSYPLSIQAGLSWTGHLPNAFCRVWIDFNNNKTFEASELVLEKTNANPLTANVLIPTTATTGTVRMRVSMKWGGYPTACEAFDKGEVEDYNVQITEGGVTPTPSFTVIPATELDNNFSNSPVEAVGAIGQNHTVIVSNSVLLIQDKQGNVVKRTTTGSLLGTGAFDPQIFYDTNEKRWFAMASGYSTLLVAVSKTPDPTGEWYNFTINGNNDGGWFDFPRMGFNKDLLLISSSYILPNMQGRTTVILDKKRLIAGSLSELSRENEGFSFKIPAIHHDTMSNGLYLLTWGHSDDYFRYELLTYTKNNNTVSKQVQTISLPFVQTANTSGYSPQSGAWLSQKKGTCNPLPVGVGTMGNLGNMFFRNGHLWLTMGLYDQSVYLDENLPFIRNSFIGWWQLNPVTKVFVQSGILQDTANQRNFFQPALAVNNRNDVILGFSTTSANSYVSAAFAYRLASDAPSTMRTPTTYKNGVVELCQGERFFRLGDYSSSHVDGGDDINLWTLQESALNTNLPIYTWTKLNLNTSTNPCDNDTQAPVFANCPQNQSRISGAGACETFLWTPPTATDNCNTPSVSFRSKSGNPLNINSSATQAIYMVCQSLGTDSIFYTATDAKGNKSVCAFELKAINACAVVPTTATLPTIVNLTTTNNCATYKWQVPADYFPCGRPCQYTGWTFISASPTVNVTRVSALCSQIVLDSACFPIGTTEVTYRDYNNNLKTFRVVVANNSGNDIALSIASTPSVYKRYTPLNFTISAKNNGNQAFTNVKIEFKFPTNTTNGGTAIPSVGVWNEWCAGSVQCFTWTIPTLASNANASLSVPVYVLNATAPIVATAKLLSSTPTDPNTANNTASINVNPAPVAVTQSQVQATQKIPVVIQKINPNPSDGEILIELESLDERVVQFNFSNTIGRTVLSQLRKVEKGQNRLLFDVSEFPQGIYFVAPNTNQGHKVPTKFVKM